MQKTYNPKDFEDRIYADWENSGAFRAEVDENKVPFTIMMPPPNITGQLHMGHAMDATLQDTLIRFKRMQGYSALWLPGCDHASIATEVKIVEKMKEMYDAIIVGSGIAGMTAVIYLKRGGLNPLIIEENAPGGQLNKINMIENYPGFIKTEGPTLAAEIFSQVRNLDIEYLFDKVIKVDLTKEEKKVVTGGITLYCKYLIIATGRLSKKLFDNEYKELKKFDSIAKEIDALDEEMIKLSDEELKEYTNVFKERLAKGETLDDILVEAFAVCREAAYRCVKMKPFYCQLLGGLAIHYGNIAEMKTGEGKTLTGVLPAYLNALDGKGVHIVTVNDSRC